MSGFFYGCQNLSFLNISNFDTSNVVMMNHSTEGFVKKMKATHNASYMPELDDYIELIAKCQQPDGYISTKQIIADMQKKDGTSARLGDINDFECYNFGHLFTAACTYKRITGNLRFLKRSRSAEKQKGIPSCKSSCCRINHSAAEPAVTEILVLGHLFPADWQYRRSRGRYLCQLALL